MKWDFTIVVLLVEWSSFRGGLKAGFYCTLRKTIQRTTWFTKATKHTELETHRNIFIWRRYPRHIYIYIRICNLKLQMCVNNRRRQHVEKRMAKRFSEADTPRTTV